MNSFRWLVILPILLTASILHIGCKSETEQGASGSSGSDQTQSSPSSSATWAIAKLDVGAAGISMEPLESTDSGEAETLFKSLSPNATGIDFVNPIDQSHPWKYPVSYTHLTLPTILLV